MLDAQQIEEKITRHFTVSVMLIGISQDLMLRFARYRLVSIKIIAILLKEVFLRLSLIP